MTTPEENAAFVLQKLEEYLLKGELFIQFSVKWDFPLLFSQDDKLAVQIQHFNDNDLSPINGGGEAVSAFWERNDLDLPGDYDGMQMKACLDLCNKIKAYYSAMDKRGPFIGYGYCHDPESVKETARLRDLMNKKPEEKCLHTRCENQEEVCTKDFPRGGFF